MAKRVRRIEFPTVNRNNSGAIEVFNAYADAIVGTGTGWSIGQAPTIYDSLYVYMRLDHTSGAQMAFNVAGGTSAQHVSSANAYAGATTINDYEVAIAYKHAASGGSFPTVDDTTNPKDDVTFVSTANSFNFMAWGPGYLEPQFDDFTGSVVAICDTANASVYLMSVDDSITPNWFLPWGLFIFLDDVATNWLDLISGTDTEYAFAALIYLNDDIDNQTWSTDYADSKMSFINEAGSYIDSAVPFANTGYLTRDFASTDPNIGNGNNNGLHQRERVKVNRLAGPYPQGTKGLLHEDVYHVIRGDAVPNQVYGPLKQYFHTARGHSIPWPPSYGALR